MTPVFNNLTMKFLVVQIRRSYCVYFILHILWKRRNMKIWMLPSEKISPNCAVYNILFLLFFKVRNVFRARFPFPRYPKQKNSCKSKLIFLKLHRIFIKGYIYVLGVRMLMIIFQKVPYVHNFFRKIGKSTLDEFR